MDSSGSRAHNVDDRLRTADIQLDTERNVDFESLLLPEYVLLGLRKSGFVRPSPIQMEAIPIGRCGFDMIVQAKSGTGKTCVFAVLALEAVKVDCKNTQVLILAPTREIAAQIVQVIVTLSVGRPELRCHMFIGGMPIAEDKIKLKRCHIAVGSPGRIKQLINEGFLKTDAIRLFVLDEADKLLDSKFQQSINWIYHKLPSSKQMLAMSATYPETLAQLLTRYMQSPTFVRLNAENPALLGIKQFYQLTAFHPTQQKAYENKIPHLLWILSSLPFSQCFIFSNYQLRAQSLCDRLCSSGWPSMVISGRQDQAERLKAINKLKKFECRILVSTDLTARGIDAENVNLVINLDVPWDTETYLHRIGRAGRYGSHGIAITLTSEGEERNLLKEIQQNANLDIASLPDKENTCSDLWSFEFTKFDGMQSKEEIVNVLSHESTGSITETLAVRTAIGTENREEHNEDDNKIVVGAAFIESLKAQRNFSLENAGLKLKKHKKRLSEKSSSISEVLVKADLNGGSGLKTKSAKDVSKEETNDSCIQLVVESKHKAEIHEDRLRAAVNGVLASVSNKSKRYLSFEECEEELARFARNKSALEQEGGRKESKSIINASGDAKSRSEYESVIFNYLNSNLDNYLTQVETKLKDDFDRKELNSEGILKYIFETSRYSTCELTNDDFETLPSSLNVTDCKECKEVRDFESKSVVSEEKESIRESDTSSDCESENRASENESDGDDEMGNDTERSAENRISSKLDGFCETGRSSSVSQYEQWVLWYSCLKARKFHTFYTTYMKYMMSKRI